MEIEIDGIVKFSSFLTFLLLFSPPSGLQILFSPLFPLLPFSFLQGKMMKTKKTKKMMKMKMKMRRRSGHLGRRHC